MKKSTILPLAALLIASVACKKYVNAPSIELVGNKVVKVELNGTYTESGATAENYKGKDISADITMSNTIDQDLVGDYSVYYDVTDSKEHDAVTVERTIQVRNAADYLDGFYNVSYDMIIGTSTNNSSGTTIDEVQSSNTINNRFYMQKPAALYATITGSTVTVPLQGDIATGQWQGTGTVDADGNLLIDIDYVSPTTSYSLSMEYTKH